MPLPRLLLLRLRTLRRGAPPAASARTRRSSDSFTPAPGLAGSAASPSSTTRSRAAASSCAQAAHVRTWASKACFSSPSSAPSAYRSEIFRIGVSFGHCKCCFKLCIAARTLDFTVPSGAPVRSAISVCVIPSK